MQRQRGRDNKRYVHEILIFNAMDKFCKIPVWLTELTVNEKIVLASSISQKLQTAKEWKFGQLENWSKVVKLETYPTISIRQPSDVSFSMAIIFAYLAPFSSPTVRSATDTSMVGYRKNIPVPMTFLPQQKKDNPNRQIPGLSSCSVWGKSMELTKQCSQHALPFLFQTLR